MSREVLVCRAAALFVSMVSIGEGAVPPEPSRTPSTLEQLRQATPTDFTLQVEVDRPVHVLMPGQGRATYVIGVTVGGDVMAIVWKASRLPDPKYYPPGTGGYQAVDYDMDGNLIVAMESEGATFRNQQIHEEYSEHIAFQVAAEGAAKPGATGGFLNLRAPSGSNTVSLNLLRRVLWALGRPWADSLGDVISEDQDGLGTHGLRVEGSWAPGYGSGAVCDMLIEPGTDHLIRQASFGAKGEPSRAECRTEGTRRFDTVALAERGEFTLRSESIAVRLVSFSPKFDKDLTAEARRTIARAQTRLVHVSDYRTDPDHPKVRLVPAGELDKDN